MKRMGILAVQGAFIEHETMLANLGAECIELRQKKDITENHFDGIILPGGESTVQGKLLRELDMFVPLKKLIQDGIPVLATCAGLILLAEEITNDENRYFATLPVTVQRNAYGRQCGSFIAEEKFLGVGNSVMHFIRAPSIERVENSCEVLAQVRGKPVAVRWKNQNALAFHPEVGTDDRIHRLFLNQC